MKRTEIPVSAGGRLRVYKGAPIPPVDALLYLDYASGDPYGFAGDKWGGVLPLNAHEAKRLASALLIYADQSDHAEYLVPVYLDRRAWEFLAESFGTHPADTIREMVESWHTAEGQAEGQDR